MEDVHWVREYQQARPGATPDPTQLMNFVKSNGGLMTFTRARQALTASKEEAAVALRGESAESAARSECAEGSMAGRVSGTVTPPEGLPAEPVESECAGGSLAGQVSRLSAKDVEDEQVEAAKRTTADPLPLGPDEWQGSGSTDKLPEGLPVESAERSEYAGGSMTAKLSQGGPAATAEWSEFAEGSTAGRASSTDKLPQGLPAESAERSECAEGSTAGMAGSTDKFPQCLPVESAESSDCAGGCIAGQGSSTATPPEGLEGAGDSFASQTWRESTGRLSGPEGYQFGDVARLSLIKVKEVVCRVQASPGASLVGSRVSNASQPRVSETSLGLSAADEATSSCVTSDRRTWKEFSERAEGPEKYQFGDVARGLGKGLVALLVGRDPRVGATLKTVSVDDLQPVNKMWFACRDWDRSEAASGSQFARVPDSSVLGQGAYGVVWRAIDRTTKERFAVKNIPTQQRRRLGPSPMAKRECEVSERMLLHPHPFIVRLFEVFFFEDNGMYLLVMEFCSGGSLQDVLRSKRRGTDYKQPSRVHSWVAQVFLGLEHMHLTVETLNRDVKPDNVVLKNDVAKLTDFGFGKIARESGGGWTFGIPTGSPGYCAPEILRQEPYDARADLYSLGVLMWVALTGGLTRTEKPMPPITPVRGHNFEALANDCHLLARCVKSPLTSDARPLEEPARDLVLQLCSPDRDSRPLHAAVREHAYMRSLSLPELAATSADLEMWAATKRSPQR